LIKINNDQIIYMNFENYNLRHFKNEDVLCGHLFNRIEWFFVNEVDTVSEVDIAKSKLKVLK